MKATDSNLWKEIPHSTNRVMSRILDGQEALNRIKTTYPDWYLDFNENHEDKNCPLITQVFCPLTHVNYGLVALIVYLPNNFMLYEFRHNKTKPGHVEAIKFMTGLVDAMKTIEEATR